MRYTIYPIIRIKDLEDDYFEVIIRAKREKEYKPGSILYVRHSDGQFNPYAVASGMNDPWIRLLGKKGTNDELYNARGKLKIRTDIDNLFPELYEDETAAFICTGLWCSCALAYVSTFPGSKAPIYTIGDVPNITWLKNYPQAQICANLDELKKLNLNNINKDLNYYILAEKKSAQAIKNLLASADIHNIKCIN